MDELRNSRTSSNEANVRPNLLRMIFAASIPRLCAYDRNEIHPQLLSAFQRTQLVLIRASVDFQHTQTTSDGSEST